MLLKLKIEEEWGEYFHTRERARKRHKKEQETHAKHLITVPHFKYNFISA